MIIIRECKLLKVNYNYLDSPNTTPANADVNNEMVGTSKSLNDLGRTHSTTIKEISDELKLSNFYYDADVQNFVENVSFYTSST